MHFVPRLFVPDGTPVAAVYSRRLNITPDLVLVRSWFGWNLRTRQLEPVFGPGTHHGSHGVGSTQSSGPASPARPLSALHSCVSCASTILRNTAEATSWTLPDAGCATSRWLMECWLVGGLFALDHWEAGGVSSVEVCCSPGARTGRRECLAGFFRRRGGPSRQW